MARLRTYHDGEIVRAHLCFHRLLSLSHYRKMAVRLRARGCSRRFRGLVLDLIGHGPGLVLASAGLGDLSSRFSAFSARIFWTSSS